jgi:hypothetical protein
MRAAKLAEILPLVDVRVALPQYRQLSETSPFTVVELTFEALRLLIRTPPFTLTTCTDVRRIVAGTNTLMLTL